MKCNDRYLQVNLFCVRARTRVVFDPLLVCLVCLSHAEVVRLISLVRLSWRSSAWQNHSQLSAES